MFWPIDVTVWQMRMLAYRGLMRRGLVLALLIVVAAASIGGWASARPRTTPRFLSERRGWTADAPLTARSDQFPARLAHSVVSASRTADGERSLPPYEVLDFTAVGANAAWAVTIGNQLRDPQSVQRSTDGGAHWADVTPSRLSRASLSMTISSTDFLSPSRAWVADSVDHPTLLTTRDGGRIWTRVGRLPSSACELQFVNPVDGWCVKIDGAAGSEFVAIYRTTTAGRTWREVSHNAAPGKQSTPDPVPFACDKSLAFTSPTDGFASSFCNGGGGYIYATADGGARWHRRLSVPTPGQGSAGAAFTAVVASRDAAAAGYTVQGYKVTPTSSVVYHSTDRGARWSKVQPPGPPKGYDVDILTPSAWRLIAGRTVLATNDAGHTWTHVTANVALGDARFPAQVLFATPNVGWDLPSLADSDNALHTTDGGRHWTTIHVPQ